MLPILPKQTRRKIIEISGDRRNCHDAILLQPEVEKAVGYHKRSLSEAAMYRVKQLLGGKLSLRNYNAQVGETYAMIKV